jgi:hypothetical protein
MQTIFALIPECSPLDIEIGVLNKFLPAGMHAEAKPDRTYITVETEAAEDSRAQPLVDRQLDLIFFITCVRVHAEMCCRQVSSDLVASYRVHGGLQHGKQPQSWSGNLGLQLRLWSVAVDISDPPTKLLLFFQIIELSCPVYIRYVDDTKVPDPKTEAKLLRHLVSHAGKPDQIQTQKYLQYLKLPPMLSNRSDPTWLRIIAEKVALVEAEARAVIQAVL